MIRGRRERERERERRKKEKKREKNLPRNAICVSAVSFIINPFTAMSLENYH